jgi:hypothetical protein
MADERLNFAIGRIERALSRIEKLAISPSASDDSDLSKRHEKLKCETIKKPQLLLLNSNINIFPV